MAKSIQHITLGICGGIAAYKSAELIRLLKKQNKNVQVILTSAGAHFITPLTLQALSGKTVLSDAFAAETELAMDHISLARETDLLLIAPATANIIAKLSMGLADDLLTTMALATPARIAIAPAMNQQMWHHPATEQNLQTLQTRGILVWGPDNGAQACGDVGFGRMLEPASLLQHIEALNQPQRLAHRKILITAGPTQEWIDPVRFISNASSGRMGYALATAATEMGAEVTLVTGPSSLPRPNVHQLVEVVSAEQMLEAVNQRIEKQDIFVATAAVADYTPASVNSTKISKKSQKLQIELVATKDILASISARKKRPYCVGFAAQTHDVISLARAKLHDKQLDIIIANDVSDASIGFNSMLNQVTVLTAEEELSFPKTSKTQLAWQLMDLIAEKYHARHSSKNSR